jgi:hypothetical protein
MWPHERPEAHFTSHRLLLDKPILVKVMMFFETEKKHDS